MALPFFVYLTSGVLWRGSQIFPGAIETVKLLRKQGKKIGFVTNNNSVARKDLCKKLNDRGFEANLNECFCTSFLAAKYLKENLNQGRVYLVGNRAMAEELENFDINYFGLGPDNFPENMPLHEMTVPEIENVGAVLVGYDRFISLKKIMNAMTYLSVPEVLFIATNMDTVFPLSGGKLSPGTGTIVSSIITPSARQPTIVGKPYKPMFDLVRDCLNVEPEKTVMLGDRIDTDILFAVNAGLKSILFLSGVTSQEQYHEHSRKGFLCGKVICKPDMTLKTIKDLIDKKLI